MDLINFSKFCWCLDLKDAIKLIAILTFDYHFSPFVAFAYDISCGYLSDPKNDINDTHLLLWSSWLIPSFTGSVSALFLIMAILLVVYYVFWSCERKKLISSFNYHTQDTHQLYNIYLNLSFVTLFVSTTVIIGIVANMGQNFWLLLAVPGMVSYVLYVLHFIDNNIGIIIETI